MQNIFDNPSNVEKLSKETYAIPDFIMMENASRFMADFLQNLNKVAPAKVLMLCGKGNNGGDGLATARILQNIIPVDIYCPEEPVSPEAKAQYKLCKNLGLTFVEKINSSYNVVVDCIFGTGFHGDLPASTKTLLDKINATSAVRVACDIPSGLYFKADFTLTMGTQKLALYSDQAKSVCGKIVPVNLGINQKKFEELSSPAAFLIEKTDIKLPFRENPAAHKGTYGHTAVFAGEKSGAAIMAATSAMSFGSGLTTLVKTSYSNLEQFKISPELMISNSIPAKTTAIVIGSGLGTTNIDETISDFYKWFSKAKSPACVIDADLFSWEKLPDLLEKLNGQENARIILTPHIKELERLAALIKFDITDRVTFGKKITAKYPNITLVMKSANTYIASAEEIFICADGTQNLAKGGSGDILAGMIGSLLAQGYTSKDAAITACEAHALASKKLGAEAFNVTPEVLIKEISSIG